MLQGEAGSDGYRLWPEELIQVGVDRPACKGHVEPTGGDFEFQR